MSSTPSSSNSSRARRVVVTGIGVVSPLGNSKEELWEGLSTGRSGIAPIEELEGLEGGVRFGGAATEFSGHIDNFGELADKAQKKMIRKGLKMMCRETKMGVAAAQRALQDAGLAVGDYDPERTGCVFGSDYMMSMPEDFLSGVTKCTDEGDFSFNRWGTDGLSMVNPLWLLLYLPNMPASHVAIYNDLRGTSNSLTHREAAPNLAIGEATQIIERGRADVMVAGATGTRLHPMNMMHAMSQETVADNGIAPEKASRPFDAERRGAALGEGAGVVILEELERAQARGATIYGEVLGSASSSVTKAPSVGDRKQAVVNALRGALRSAGLEAPEIGHIHAHGLSCPEGDAEEAAAIAEVFGSVEEQPPTVAAKSHFGNLGAGSGAVEFAGSLMALKSKTLFPVLNFETADANCPVRVATDGESPSGESFANINVTPQGQASVLIVRSIG